MIIVRALLEVLKLMDIKKKKTSNSNPLKSLFEVENFLRKISKLKNVFGIVNNTKKLKKINPH